ncbi:MAG: MFS transporter [Anaerolineae bacterium]
MRTKLQHINLPLAAIVAEGFLSRLSFGVVSFALPLYAHHLGLSLTEIGLLASLNTIIAIALKPVTGWAADRFGLKRIFIIAISLRSLVAILLAFAGAPWQLYSIRTAHGLATSLRDPSSNALIAENGGKQAVASAFAWYQTAKSVAGSLGKAFAGLLLALTAANYPLVFLAAFLLSVLPLIVVLLYVKESDRLPEATKTPAAPVIAPAPPQTRGRANLLDRWQAVMPFIGFGFLVSTTAEMMTGLFPILATDYAGLTEAQAGLIFSISTLTIMVAGPVFGWISDNVSRKFVLAVRSIFNTLSSLIFLFAPSFIGMTIGKIADDVGKSAFRPAWGSLMTHVSGLPEAARRNHEPHDSG